MNADELMGMLGDRHRKPLASPAPTAPSTFADVVPAMDQASSDVDGDSPLATVLEIDPDVVKLHKKLGEGTFGVVYSGTWNGTPVAIKTLKEAVDEAEFIREVRFGVRTCRGE